MKSNLKDQIIDLLKGKTGPEKLIYIEGEYFVQRAGELVKLSDNEILKLLPDSEILAFFVNKKQWCETSSSWEGPEIEPLPEILKGKKVQEITVTSEESAKKLTDFIYKNQ